MLWETVLNQTYTVESGNALTLPATFNPFHRLIISTSLLAGLGDQEPFLGTLSQHLILPDFSDVKGSSFDLAPFLQLITPATEFPYRLVFQPIDRRFRFTLTIQVEAAISSPSGADNAPVLAAIALLRTQIDGLQPGGNATTDPQILAAIANQVSALSTGQTAISNQVSALSTQLENLFILTQELRTIALTPSAFGVPYLASQSSNYGGNGTYTTLTDGDGTTGTITYDGGGWLKATFPVPVRVAAVQVGGGNVRNVGTVARLANGSALQYSTNNANWTTVLTLAGVTDSGMDQFKTFVLTAPITARYWRLNRTDDETGTSEFKFT